MENFKLDFTGGLGNFQNKWGGRGWGIPKITGGTLTWGGGRKITEGMQVIRNRVFWGAEWFWNSLNSLNIVLDFFGTGNVIEKILVFRIALELFLNFEFLTINFLGYNIPGCPMFGSPICDKILFPFCPRDP